MLALVHCSTKKGTLARRKYACGSLKDNLSQLDKRKLGNRDKCNTD